jgi:hypothetical protein
VKLVQKQSPNIGQRCNLSLSINEVFNNLEYSSKLVEYEAELSINVQDKSNINDIFIELENRGSVSPSRINDLDDISYIKESLSVVIPDDQSPLLRIYFKIEGNEVGPFVFKVPSYKTLKLAEDLISGSINENHIEKINDYYGKETDSDAIFDLLGDLDSWMSIRSHFQLLDAGARLSDEIQESLSANSNIGFLGEQIAFPENNIPYSINSMEELNQIISTCDRLEYIPDVSAYECITTSLQFIKSENLIEQFWQLEKKFDLARQNWNDLLYRDQIVTLMALAVAKKEYDRAQDIIVSWVDSSSKEKNVDDLIDRLTESNASLDDWKELLVAAIEKNNQQLDYCVCWYLREYDKHVKDFNFDRYLRELMAEARAKISDRTNFDFDYNLATAKYHMLKAGRIKDDGDYSTAADHYEKSLEPILEMKSYEDYPEILQPYKPLYWLHIMRAQTLADNKGYDEAYEKIEDGIDLIESYSSNDIQSANLSIQRLKANKYEMKGDEALENKDLEQAETHYGRAIYNYTEIDRNNEREYLLKRNKLITASLAEQRGDYDAAKQAHENVAELAHNESFETFNLNRSQICKAKQLIIENSFSEVSDILNDMKDSRGLPMVEAQHLNLLVDVYNSYNIGELQNCGKVLNELNELPNISDVADEFPFEYGHDYRPALVNLLGAQRFKKAGVDENLLEKLIKVSLQSVLAPNQAKIEIDQWGIGNIGLYNEWRLRLPTHIVKRYEELNGKVAKGDDLLGEENYSDEALGLLRLLEQTLEFAGDYFAHRSYGADWQHKFTDHDDGRLTLGGLRSFLNDEVMEDRIWNEGVCDLLDKEIIEVKNVMELRNQFGHDRKPSINEEEYEEIDERINEIFSLIKSEIPVMCEVMGQHQLGGYKVKIHWENASNFCYLTTVKDLDQDEIYYLPTDYDIGEKVINSNESEIIKCSSNRALDNLREYTSI